MECLKPWVSVFRWGQSGWMLTFFQSNAARCFQPEIFLASVNGCGSAPSVRREMTAQVQVKVLLFVAMPA